MGNCYNSGLASGAQLAASWCERSAQIGMHTWGKGWIEKRLLLIYSFQ